MKNYSKIVAIIPARGGSKGLPGKNIALCNKKPLIGWTIEAALSSQVQEVIVTSDDEKILKAAAKYSSVIIDKRPIELATDTTASEEVITYILEKYNLSEDCLVMLLQPTSPCRNSKHINEAIKLLKESIDLFDSLISVKEITNKYLKCFLQVNGKAKPINNENYPFMRRQDLPNLFLSNGAIYIVKVKDFKKHKSFYRENRTMLYPMDLISSIDIDNSKDLQSASRALKFR